MHAFVSLLMKTIFSVSTINNNYFLFNNYVLFIIYVSMLAKMIRCF